MRVLLRGIGLLVGVLAVVAVAGIVYLRVLAAETEPVFVIEHEIEIDAPPDEVWKALTDFDAYGEWNPYVQRLEGDLAPGGTFTLIIIQENWEQPLTLHPTMVTFDAPDALGWHGTAIVTGVLETDHFFRLEPIGADRTRLLHAEEFRGWLAYRIDDEEHHRHTRAAFRAMNEALAARVERAS